MNSADRTPWKDRGWSWPSLLAGSGLVGVSAGAMTYFAEWGDRGSVVFGAVMGIGWFVVFGLVKVVRTRGEPEDRRTGLERWLAGHWRTLVLFVLLSLLAFLEVGLIATGRWVLAIAEIALAIPFVVLLVIEQRRVNA